MEIFQNWSIAKLENGRYTSLKLGAENFEDQILNLPLESGNYRILTSNRLPNGNMFANEYHFEIQPERQRRSSWYSGSRSGGYAGE